jgi:hypothetical protein
MLLKTKASDAKRLAFTAILQMQHSADRYFLYM